MNRCVVLLTATIRPRGDAIVPAEDEHARELEYSAAVEFHARALRTAGSPARLVVAENSAAPAEKLLESCRAAGAELFRFPPAAVGPSKGKGYLEALLVTPSRASALPIYPSSRSPGVFRC
jgi:hypothetical protein